MDLKLTNKVAVVTGGASGIGAATATMLQQEGCRVVVMDRRLPNANDSLSSQLIRSEVDVTSVEQIATAWADVESSVGPIDIVVHAAAIGSGHFGFPYTNVPVSAWDDVLRVNILGMTNIAHVAGPAMSARRSGAMVFLASVAGQMGSQTDPPYSAQQSREHQLCSVHGEGSGSVWSSRQHSLPGHGEDIAERIRLASLA